MKMRFLGFVLVGIGVGIPIGYMLHSDHVSLYGFFVMAFVPVLAGIAALNLR